LPYNVDISDAERAYLANLPLSAKAKDRLRLFIVTFLENVPDPFRLDPLNRPAAGKPYFLVQHIIRDIWGDGRLHLVDFYVRDDGAPFGVLLIVYIDHH
jgi:hypothetical protein